MDDLVCGGAGARVRRESEDLALVAGGLWCMGAGGTQSLELHERSARAAVGRAARGHLAAGAALRRDGWVVAAAEHSRQALACVAHPAEFLGHDGILAGQRFASWDVWQSRLHADGISSGGAARIRDRSLWGELRGVACGLRPRTAGGAGTAEAGQITDNCRGGANVRRRTRVGLVASAFW